MRGHRFRPICGVLGGPGRTQCVEMSSNYVYLVLFSLALWCFVGFSASFAVSFRWPKRWFSMILSLRRFRWFLLVTTSGFDGFAGFTQGHESTRHHRPAAETIAAVGRSWLLRSPLDSQTHFVGPTFKGR